MIGDAAPMGLGGPVNVVDHGGSGPPALLIHGLGGSVSSWDAVAAELRGMYHVVAVDLIGFGDTPAAGRRSTIHANRDLLIALLRVLGEPSLVVGNSMGALVAMSAAAANTDSVDRLVVVDPAIPPARPLSIDSTTLLSIALPSLPGVGPLVLRASALRRSPAEQVAHTLAMVCSDVSSVDPSYIERAIESTQRRRTQEWAARSFGEAGRSMLRLLSRRTRFRRMVHSISCPVLVVHGADDRLVPMASVDALIRQRPDWTLHVLEGVGHVPPIESPHRLSAAILDWAEGRTLRPESGP